VALDERGEHRLERDAVEGIAGLVGLLIGHGAGRRSPYPNRLSNARLPAKKKPNNKQPTSAERVKEACACIRRARVLWDAHKNAACRGERAKAIVLYEALTHEEREKVPQQLRVWLRYRSEKYFGDHTTPPGG